MVYLASVYSRRYNENRQRKLGSQCARVCLFAQARALCRYFTVSGRYNTTFTIAVVTDYHDILRLEFMPILLIVCQYDYVSVIL